MANELIVFLSGSFEYRAGELTKVFILITAFMCFAHLFRQDDELPEVDREKH